MTVDARALRLPSTHPAALLPRSHGLHSLIGMSAFAALLALASVSAHAEEASPQTLQRNVNQQTRIEHGLQDGSLSVQEAGRLEREQAQVNRAQARALRDGQIDASEQARLDAAQDRVSKDIRAARHNGERGDPQAPASQRLQADVARQVKQQERIQAGVANGSLTGHEAARLEAGQARVARKEARVAADGHVGAAEQARVQRAENRQSRHIHRQKHDGQVAEPAATPH